MYPASAPSVYQNGQRHTYRRGVTELHINDQLLSHLSPLGWEHINLTGDYIWRNNKKLAKGKYRPLRAVDVSQYKKQS
ncbi:hypothetical protein CLB51_24645 [Salmonella enterica]|nr:hypothetical protein [Salmonella enterica]EDR9399289.1 transposase [Salmonella enterica subsp. enterica]EDT6893233.1 transposase [Salmonella enterica subsp. enterica serovar Javiana]EDX5193570.1 transposase [Salmonella enterica subsp. enterica serovar Glostrup]EED2931560.1 transposase [Salmonella enterica subsp. enterica serovar Javiana]